MKSILIEKMPQKNSICPIVLMTKKRKLAEPLIFLGSLNTKERSFFSPPVKILVKRRK